MLKHGVGEHLHLRAQELASLALEGEHVEQVSARREVTHQSTGRGEPQILDAVAMGEGLQAGSVGPDDRLGRGRQFVFDGPCVMRS